MLSVDNHTATPLKPPNPGAPLVRGAPDPHRDQHPHPPPHLEEGVRRGTKVVRSIDQFEQLITGWHFLADLYCWTEILVYNFPDLKLTTPLLRKTIINLEIIRLITIIKDIYPNHCSSLIATNWW